MARERRLDAHLGRLGVAHLPHQDHVGGLPQHGSDDPREIEADLVLDLHLIDAGEVILDRIFRGDDLGVGAVELVERGVERGRLARARRTGDEDDAVGAANQVFELPEIVFGEPQLPDADLDVVFVEDPHHDRLAVVGGQDADAEIVVFAVGGELDPAVLRASAFGDVELGENLDAGEHRPQQAAGRVVALYQTAVDAVTDADPVFEGLDVDVARPQLHRLGDDQVDKLHHRGVGVVFLGRGGLLLDCRLGEVDGGVGELLEHRVGALAVGEAVVAVDRLDDLLADSERHLDLAIQDKPQLLLRVHVGGIAGGNAERAARLREREDGVFAGHALRKELHDLLGHGDFGEVDELEAVGLGQHLHHLCGVGVPEPDHLVVDLLARCARHPQRLRELLGGDEALGDEDLGECVGWHGGGSGRRGRGGQAGCGGCSRNVSECS